MKAETYQTHPKYVLQENGLFEWQRNGNNMCRCGHKQSLHLDSISICLDKSKVDLTGTCICEIFTSPNETISTYVPKKRLPRKEETADIIVKEGKTRTNSCVNTGLSD